MRARVPGKDQRRDSRPAAAPVSAHRRFRGCDFTLFCIKLISTINLSQEAEALAKWLAATQSLSVEDAIKLALEEKARAAGIAMEARRTRDQSPEAVAARRTRTNRFVAELAALPVVDPRPPRDIMDDLDAL